MDRRCKNFQGTEVKWDVTFNLAVNRNKVKSLVSEGAQDWAGKGVVQGSGTEVLAEGHPVGAVLGYQTDGNSSPGHRSKNIIKRHRS